MVYKHQIMLFVWLLSILVTKSSSNGRITTSSGSRAGRYASITARLSHEYAPGNKTRVLVLDVDGTLYPTSGQSDDIEIQLRDNGYSFFEHHMGMNSTACDALYKEHGSILPGVPRSLFDKFCRDVYDAVSLYPLRVYSASALSIPDGTGYSHHEVMLHRDALKALQAISSNGTMIVIASNSPRRHIFRVIDRLGIPRGIVSDVFSPDTHEERVKSDPIFWKSLLGKYPIDSYELTLIDDSSKSIATAARMGLQTIEVNSTFPFPEALREFMGLPPIDENFVFNSVNYLRAKNIVDQASFDKEIIGNVSDYITEIRAYRRQVLIDDSKNDTESALLVVDLGSGVLNMLRHVLIVASNLIDRGNELRKLVYVAFESNLDLLDAASAKLTKGGFHEVGFPKLPGSKYFQLNLPSKAILQSVEIHIFCIPEDFLSSSALKALEVVKGEVDRTAVDLIIGCCVADLVPPEKLVMVIEDMAGVDGSVVYLPITFCGKTEIKPSTRHLEQHQDWYDQLADFYDRYLVESARHFVSSSHLLSTIESIGGSNIVSASSCWKISGENNRYMWSSMLKFILNGAFFSVATKNLSKPTFIDGLRALLTSKKADIVVQNKDILFNLQPLQLRQKLSSVDAVSDVFVEFMGPRNVRVRKVSFPCSLSNEEVLFKAQCSLVSTGTELKIFRGELDNSEPLDTSINGFTDKSMSYPLRYGYCMVGNIKSKGCSCTKSLNDTASYFTFSPHGMYSKILEKDLIRVPDDISHEDAVFAPSVETAVSLVQDAAPVLGEKVAIVGQGLIGVLTAAALRAMDFDVTVIDVNVDRLNVSKRFCPPGIKIWNPRISALLDKFDVCIEITGTMAGLQTAVDSTASGGRVIIGSWFGGSNHTLYLGTSFHRSHITLKASQVSTVPAHLSMRWSKSRRFALVWNVLRQLRPSRLLELAGRRMSLTNVDSADFDSLSADILECYSRLDRGLDLTTLIRYK